MADNGNHLIITGNLTRDPELKFGASGKAYANFSIAWNQSKRAPNGEWESIAHFFDGTAFDDVAENLATSCGKGMRVTCVGELRQDRWKDKATDENRSKVVFVANDVSPSLRWATAVISKVEKDNSSNGDTVVTAPSEGDNPF